MRAVLAYLRGATLSSNKLIIIVSCYVVFVFNFPFLSRTLQAILSLDEYDILFLISVPLFLLSLMVIFISLLSVKYLFKPLVVLLIMLSAIVFYATTSYGIVFDYGMVQNSMETYSAEAQSYINYSAILFLSTFAILPCVWLSQVRIHYQSFIPELWQRTKLMGVSVITILIIAYFFYPNYAAVGRNNHNLVDYIVPFKLIDATFKYSRDNYFSPPLDFEVLDTRPQHVEPAAPKKKVMVMVVGETARAQSFSLNGYHQDTNPYTQSRNVVSFKNMHSCGTATAVSVPCMFSMLSKDNFNKRQAVNQQNLLDLVHLAGYDVLWIDNNSSCKGVCTRVPTSRITPDANKPLCDGDYCFDEVLLKPLAKKLTNLKNASTLIVLHIIGSHGPTYYRRYPEQYARFQPDCQRSDIQNCSSQELVNTYDNTILYTDYVLSQIIDQLQLLTQNNPNISTSMLYVSDHGESLGEHGVYLHGLPYTFAPEQQTHIPMLFWQAYQQQAFIDSCLRDLDNSHYSHDNIFHTVLGLLNVQSTTYQPQLDIFNTCQNNSILPPKSQQLTSAQQ